MELSYWHKQDDKPLFPDLLWARPETKAAAGKLLIVGGNTHGFAVPAAAFATAEKAGIGTARVLLPDVLERTVGKLFPAADYAPSNLSGGFAMSALAELLANAGWADGVLLAGDFGRNSETSAMLENFVRKHTGQLTITTDAADLFCAQPQSLAERQDTLLVINLGQLQQLGLNLHLPYAFTSGLGLFELVQRLHELTTDRPGLAVITRHQQNAVIAIGGQVGTSQANGIQRVWRAAAAAAGATWWLQNPAKPFAALISSLLELRDSTD